MCKEVLLKCKICDVRERESQDPAIERVEE